MGEFRFILLALIFTACATVPKESALFTGDHFAMINGANLHYRVAGKGPVCVVHPGGPGFNWTYLRMPELEKSLTMVYLEPVGAGESDRLERPEDYTFDRYVEDLEKLREHLGLEKFFLIGHSHGGMVAQIYALKHQERLKGLILYSTAPVGTFTNDFAANFKKFEKEPWYPEAISAFSTAFASKSDEEITEKFRKCYGFYVHDYSADRKRIDAAFSELAISIAPVLNGFTRELPKLDLRGRLGEIRTPTLVVVGREDAIHGVKYSTMLHDGIPGSKLVIIENSGALVNLDRPLELAKAVGDFMLSQNGPGN